MKAKNKKKSKRHLKPGKKLSEQKPLLINPVNFILGRQLALNQGASTTQAAPDALVGGVVSNPTGAHVNPPKP